MPDQPLMPAAPPSHLKPGEPYCINCGYSLVGATETSVCPECGKPLVEVLHRGRIAVGGRTRRFRTEATLFGLPVLDIAFGPEGEDQYGTARGIIAIGDKATGLLALGGTVRGVVAIGGVAAGGVAIGGVSAGVISLGGAAAGGFAVGGAAAGGLATGGGAAGAIAQGGLAVGIYARGGGAFGVHTIGPRGPSSAHAVQVFDAFSPLIGTLASQFSMMLPMAYVAAVATMLAAAIGALALYGHHRQVRRTRGS